MENRNYDNELDELIRVSMKVTDQPTTELNNNLKASLYKRESVLRKAVSTKVISLWYVPMILNIVIFSLFGILALLLIANPYLSLLTAAVCGYAGMAGVVITVVGVKRANMKENISIHIERRGAVT